MKKLFIILGLTVLLSSIVFADDWHSGCKNPCPPNILSRLAEMEGTTNLDCCYGCWEYEGSIHGIECDYRWEVFFSPLPIKSPLAVPTAKPVPSMPEWYYQPYGFPCEYLNPGNQDCICFCDAPMYCP